MYNDIFIQFTINEYEDFQPNDDNRDADCTRRKLKVFAVCSW